MKSQTKKYCLYLVVAILISSTIIIPFTFVFFERNPKKSSIIIFFPTYMKSFPNHTVWFLAEISIYDSELEQNYSFNVTTNTTVKYEYFIVHF